MSRWYHSSQQSLKGCTLIDHQGQLEPKEEHRRKLGVTNNTELTSIFIDGDPALTRAGRNRAAANPRETFMITEKEIYLHSQGEKELSKVGLTCVNTDDLLS